MNLAMYTILILKLNFKNSLTKISFHSTVNSVENDFQFHQ